MDDTLITLTPSPVRASSVDNQADILGFAIEAAQNGGSALATLVEIRGGAARALGAHVAVASDGRYCGYVSGGCVESAVATEALEAIVGHRDRIVKFGEGSPFFDIALPCGGGITIAIHVLRDTDVLKDALGDLAGRKSLALSYRPETESVVRLDQVPVRSGWRDKDFVCVYRPVTRVVISGQTGEAEAVRRLAEASGYAVTLVGSRSLSQSTVIDAFTAVVLLHHDLNLEEDLLRRALSSPAFYIGALGSTRTHCRRIDRLKSIGMPAEAFDRIKAPIGLFGPTRDSTSLALSILADVAAARSETYA
ncbi:XdhC family protein [Aliirhizobium smilacinae]|uniref:XdhC family protein n=1 Tax=Aliirhizobium smilacinae TaxID=1395944 RepID=A0A5C4XHS4_9HYPH|nr:XdhC family protein [Rhizobium smilacinae]TNM63063.1 XdhC family protein [Rhizobium smilacinae]